MTTRRTYEAKAIRDADGWWVVEVPGVEFGYTQARRLADTEPMARDMLATLFDVAPDSFDVTIRVDMPEASLVDVATELRARADNVRDAADTATRAAALALVARKVPVRDIATMLRVSPGWVSVLTKEVA